MDEATKEAFAGLTKTVERGFTAVAEDIADARRTMATKEDLKHLVTKADLAALGNQVGGIERELKTIRRELYDLGEKVENVTGYRKEIDHALERIAAIERRLGIHKKAAA